MVPLVFIRRFFPLLIKIGSPSLRRRIVEALPFKSVQRFRDVVDTLDESAKKIYLKQLAALEDGDEGIAVGKDVLSRLRKYAHLLCCSRLVFSFLTDGAGTTVQANMEADGDDKMSETEMVGQVS